MNKLKPSADRKVWAYNRQKNTIGLLPGPEGTCPGATLGPGGCRTVINPGRPNCYVYRIMSIFKGVKGVLEYNTNLLKNATKDEMIDLLDEEFIRFEKIRTNGYPNATNYRLHWAGDVFSKQYAEALREAMLRHPDTQFWTYTRSFDLVDTFKDIKNFKLYLSLDDCNVKAGMELYNKCKWDNLHLCYMGEEVPESLMYLNLIACPTDSGNLKVEGACHKCKLCLRGHNIWFKTKRN